MREVGPFALASVPTHLKRLARHADVATLRSHCCAVFSSGGPLPAETAHAIARVLGRAPLEVLGSTETGGVAWRAQEPSAEESLWAPFTAVRLARDPRSGVARVRSPFVSVDEGGDGFAMGDRVALDPDGRFRLEGVPEGPGKFYVWHDRAGKPLIMDLDMPATDALELELALTKRRIPNHRNKNGKSYRNERRRY